MKPTPIATVFLGMLSLASLPLLNADPVKAKTGDGPNRTTPDSVDQSGKTGTAAKGTETKPAKVTTGDAPNRTAPENQDKKKGLNDADVLTCIQGVDEHEIAAANVAEKKKASPAVLDYAKMMDKEHTKNLQETKALLSKTEEKPNMADKHAEKKAEDEKHLAKLSTKDGAEFDKAYITAMVKGHTEVLTELDDKLIPAAKDAAIKKHLTETRTHVSHHLEEAKKIQASM